MTALRFRANPLKTSSVQASGSHTLASWPSSSMELPQSHASMPRAHHNQPLQVPRLQLPPLHHPVHGTHGFRAPPRSQRFEQVPQVIRNALRRLNLNLAHPSNQDLVQFLSANTASLKAIVGAKAFQCAGCLRQQKPAEPRPSRIPHIGRFNSTLSMDIVYATNAIGATLMFLGVIDDATQ